MIDVVGRVVQEHGQGSRPVEQSRDVDAVRRSIGVTRNALGPTPEQHCGTDVVPPKRVGQAHCKLRQPLPEVTFGIRGGLPGGLQHLVGLEWTALVQQPLSFDQAFVRWQDKIVGNTHHPGLSTGKGSTKRIAWAGVARTTPLIAISIGIHVASGGPDRRSWTKPPSSSVTSPSSAALSALEPAFSPTTT